MLFIHFTAMLITFALYLMSKKDILMVSAYKFMKRNLMVLLIISSMNLFISVGLISKKLYAL